MVNSALGILLFDEPDSAFFNCWLNFSFCTPCFTTSMPFGWSTSISPRNWKLKKKFHHKTINFAASFLRLNYKLWSFEYRGNKHIRLIPFPFLIIRIKLYYFKFVLFTTKKHTERKRQRNKNILSRYLKSQLQFEPNPKLFLSRYLNHKWKFEIAFKIYLSQSIYL